MRGEARRGAAAHVSKYPEGMRRILTVSADTELVSACSYRERPGMPER